MNRDSFSYFISAFLLISLVCTIPLVYAASKSNTQIRKKHPLKVVLPKGSRTKLKSLSRDPYLGAIVIDAATDKVLFEDNADVMGYPASMVKMMNFLIILEAVEAGHITLEDKITVSAEAAKIGGSQVYLKENEVFTVDDLLYALIVQSANDAAVALALHYAGSKEEFINGMNKRAQELGMNDTIFHSVHGLPPGRGQLPDISTPRDMTKLSRELLKHPDALKYTSTRVRPFRTNAPEPFIMRNHNHLIGNYEGCDGLKTGYFRAAGFSIAATAAKNGARAIAVIFGSVDSKVRDTKARKFLSKSLIEIAANLSPPQISVAQGVRASVNE